MSADTPETATQVRGVFSPTVSATYELVNRILTLGCDVRWRRRAARFAAATGGTRWADMCTGPGETACYLQDLANGQAAVTAVDFSLPMMAQATHKPEAQGIHFVASDVRALPFPNESFDLLTISFATRNISLNRSVLTQTFAEFDRILKPGGRFVNLETSQPASRPLRMLYHLYVRLLVKSVGGWISGSPKGYAYLAHTIPRFHRPEELGAIMGQAGFGNVTYSRLLFGIAAIHSGTRV